MYATEDLVRVHPDGGITTIARSGNSSQQWYKLEGGRKVEVSAPKKPDARYKDDFVQMGKVSLAPKVEAELSRLRIDKAEFLKDYPSIKNAVDANPALVEGWKALLHSSPSVRRNADNLAKAKKYLDETGESITAFQRKVPVAGQKKWLDDIVKHWEDLKKLKPEFKKLSLSDAEINSIIRLYKDSPDLIPRLKGTIDELITHGGLSKESKLILLKNEEYVKTLPIRNQGLGVVPQWMNQNLTINESKLQELWLLGPNQSVHKSYPPHRIQRMEKNVIRKYDPDGIAIVLGRQGPRSIAEHKKLIKALNENTNNIRYVDDTKWSTSGLIDGGFIREEPISNLIQGVESIMRLPSIKTSKKLKNEGIVFSLNRYDVRSTMAAIYSNPNAIQRRVPLPSGFKADDLTFSYTGVTDTELANIVRNKDWFDKTQFVISNNGIVTPLSKQQVLEKYGIRYIGDLIKK